MKRKLLLGAATAASLAASAYHASAATYTDSFTIDPSTLTCQSVGTNHACFGAVSFETPRTLSVGDVLTEAVTYTTPIVTPASKVATGGVFKLYTANSTFETQPGPDVATYSTVFAGYSGPPNPILSYGPVGYANGYIGQAGFCCGVGLPSPGFTYTGQTTTFTISGTGPDPVLGLLYGYSWSSAVPEPVTWGLILVGFTAIGASLRSRRRLLA
jgi:hypothetical protein